MPAPKASPHVLLRQKALHRIASCSTLNSAHYYTYVLLGEDGAAGAAFVCGQRAEGWRTSTGAFIQQAEMAAILGALHHAAQTSYADMAGVASRI